MSERDDRGSCAADPQTPIPHQSLAPDRLLNRRSDYGAWNEAVRVPLNSQPLHPQPDHWLRARLLSQFVQAGLGLGVEVNFHAVSLAAREMVIKARIRARLTFMASAHSAGDLHQLRV